jgi:hypothetical protein
MQHKEELTDAAISAAASKVTYMGSASVGFGWLTTNEAAIFFGIILGVLGLIVNVVFKVREDRRQEKLFQEELKKYGGSD